LETYGFELRRRGLYALAPGFALRIVVLPELPRTRATVLMRLGSKKLRAEAVDEILRLPPKAWERTIAEPILVQFDFIPRQGGSPEETMLGTEILKRGEKIIQDAERKGERKGERRLLLKQLRLRFGDLPPATVARVEQAKLAQIERWGERVLTATTLDEVLG